MTRATWASLPKGVVTGIDWSKRHAIDGVDPYLIWAEVDEFHDFRLPGHKPPEWLPVIIETQPGTGIRDLLRASSTRWLQVPRVYLCYPGLRYCTARVKADFFRKLNEGMGLADVVSRYELGLPVEDRVGPLKDPATPRSTAPRIAGRVPGTVLGVIDGGLAVAHEAFRDASGKSRIKHFWRQDERTGPSDSWDSAKNRWPIDSRRAGPAPRDLSYGHELSGKAINDAMRSFTAGAQVDEAAVYEHFQMWDLKHAINHGTHVAAIAAAPQALNDRMVRAGEAPSWNKPRDQAAKADIVAVQLDWANVLDTSGGAMTVSILDALLYTFTRCTDEAQLVVNLSWGTLAGPHDGTSILEAAMDQLTLLRGSQITQIVVPSGNGYQAQTHGNAFLPPQESAVLDWYVQPDDLTPSFVELWLADPELPQEAIQSVELKLTPPGCTTALPPLKLGSGGSWPNAKEPYLTVIFPRRSALGRNGTCALLALCPTFSFHAHERVAPAGKWTIEVVNKGLNPLVLDAYIERDDIAIGTHTGARQSYFNDQHYNSSGNIDGFVDQPGNPTLIRRSGTFNSLATGRQTVDVGGLMLEGVKENLPSRYSPRKPDPDASRLPQRSDVRKVPETLAFSDENSVLWGVLAAGSLSGSMVRLVGTSSAAPQLARRVLNRTTPV
ncbi:S8 family serine peptidase [Hydrogenophaga sp. 5NK40-0174]|uniref:S8 family serine peptidase n=1 Tax=Hydrogenophaga sp. 5NK40-0174 TaxID=3127649 RepID=UPI00310AF796